MMSVGIAILAHERVDRAAAVAAWFRDQGVPLSVHLDSRMGSEELRAFSARASGVHTVSSRAAEWGRFGIVEATWAAVTPLLERPDITHVCLVSGACLPLCPMPDFAAHVARHADADFIESVPVAEHAWVEGGLSIERFTLYHPFSHRRQPGLFSFSVEAQRKLGIRRQFPKGIVPHLGGQWWCLRVETLRAIRDHPDKARWDRFFRHTWIPDESYFQSLVRVVRPHAKPAPSLHAGGFNLRGRPHVFHDDHLELLERSGRFFARKIDPDADALYRHFLSDRTGPVRPCDGSLNQALDAARTERQSEGQGLLTAARLPNGVTLTRAETARPFAVLAVDDPKMIGRLHTRLVNAATNTRVHGRLFEPGADAEFADPGTVYDGNLPTRAAFRDYRPAQFLSRLVWAERDTKLAFWLASEDDHPLRLHLVNDPNARLVLVGRARDRLAKLRAGFPRPQGPPLQLRAWYQIVSEDGEEDVLGQLATILSGDWTDPAQWEVPE